MVTDRVPPPASCHHPGTGLDAHPEVYSALNGPSECHVIGPFKDFDITGELGRIRLPTLLFYLV